MIEQAVPGFEVVRALGRGGSGEVWLAREVASGELVALKRVRTGDQEAAAREAALLSAVEHEHVVRLRSAVRTAEGLVLVLNYAGGGSLADLLAARGVLSPGEVVTLGAPLAQALAAIHLRGLVHGDVAPGNVLFSAQGSPLLADWGVSRLVGERALPVSATVGTVGYVDPSAAAGAAADVYGLAAVCHAALTGQPPGPTRLRTLAPHVPAALADAIERALATNPAGRPTAKAFAGLLVRACPAEPITLARPVPVPGASPEPVTHRIAPPGPPPGAPQGSAPAPSPVGLRDRIRMGTAGWAGRVSPAVLRRVTAGGVVALLLAGAVLVGLWWAGRDVGRAGFVPAAPAVAASDPPTAGVDPASEPDWLAVLGDLDAARSRAFAKADEALLQEVYAPGSAVLDADRSTLAKLTAAGARAKDLRLTVLEVQEEARDSGAGAEQVLLIVVDELPDYTLVGPDGTEQLRQGRGRATWRVTLQASPETAGRWQIADIVSVGASVEAGTEAGW